jgi:peptidyl-prolyl cis-trans isomerase SurA
MRLTFLIAACICPLLMAGSGHAADGPFAPRVIVNNSIVTNFEVEQRARFLQLINSPGDLEEAAVRGLIDDRLRFSAGVANGVELTEKDITAGLEEFAGRADLSVEEFQTGLAENGVEPETFRDFVQANLVWREVIRARFVPRVIVSDGDVKRALAVTNQRGDVRVALAELIIPAPPGQEADALALAQELSATIQSVDDFAAAAAQYSAAPSAADGGDVGWLELGNLPPTIRALILPLGIGGVTQPIPIPNAVALFQLRGLEDTGKPAIEAVELDYMQILLPDGDGDAAEAARLRANADQCDDLFGLTKGLPADQVVRTKLPAGEVPRDIGLELAKLDPGESSFGLRRGAARVFLMLCTRNVEIAENPPTPEAIRDQLINQRLAAFADTYLNQLRAAAIIREP